MNKTVKRLSTEEIFELTERMKPLILDLHILVNKPGLTRLEENYKALLFRVVRMYLYDFHDVNSLLNYEFLQKLNTVKSLAERSSYHPNVDEKEIVQEMIDKFQIDVPTDFSEEQMN